MNSVEKFSLTELCGTVNVTVTARISRTVSLRAAVSFVRQFALTLYQNSSLH